MNLTHPLILASKSPRRKEILKNAGIAFRSESLEVDESFEDTLPLDQVAESLAVRKNQAYAKRFHENIILTADTTVLLGNQILNKPANEEEAREMLYALSGKTHQVITGVCLSSPDHTVRFSDITDVTFKALTQNEIEYYIATYRPFDKAGAYGIQEWIGMIGITSISGSYYNVMGLPIQKVYEALLVFSN